MKRNKNGFLWRMLNKEGFSGPKDDEDDDGAVKIDLDEDKKDAPSDPKPDDDKDAGDDVDLDDDSKDDDDGSLTIDLDDDKKKQNKAFASMRAENKRLKEENERIQRLVKQSQNQPPPPVRQPAQPDVSRPHYKGIPIPNTDEEWDELAKRNWKVAVDMRAHLQAQEITKQTTQMSKNNTILEKSKERVISRHPELNDTGSEKTQIYLRILNDNPDYLTNPKGPVYAMRDMEEYMQDVLGYTPEEINKAKRDGAKKESIRQSRASLASSTGRSNPRSSNTVTLSKDELEFCKYHSIDPKDFAKNKKKTSKSGKGGIQV